MLNRLEKWMYSAYTPHNIVVLCGRYTSTYKHDMTTLRAQVVASNY